MSKSKLISVVIALLTMAGCAPGARPDPNPQPDHGPPDNFSVSPPEGPPDYHVLLMTDPEPAGAHFYEDRWGDCSIIGYNADKRVVTIKDSKTGLKVPYQLYIEDIRIPYDTIYDLPVINKDKAASTIEVVCTIFVYAGDAVDMTVTNADRTGSAALTTGIPSAQAPRDMDPERLWPAFVTATIAVL